MSMIQDLRTAWPIHEKGAKEAYSLFVTHCDGKAPCRVPGMDTVYRLALRLHYGRTIQEAAAREYLYRWNLALKSRCFGVPHTIGM